MRVFLDTNVWVSAFMAPGLCEDLLFNCAEQNWVLSSELVWRELEAVLTHKVHASSGALTIARTVWTETTRIPDVPTPANDNDARLVAAASAAHADFFVTGDRRVVDWKQSGTMRIVSPREAWIELFAPYLRGK